MAGPEWHMLPPELIEHQIAQVDLLMAMYPGDEITMEESSRSLFDSLNSSLADHALPRPNTHGPSPINLLLHLSIEEDKSLQLDINVPFAYEGNAPPDEAPSINVRIRQPSWLNRATTTHLNANISEDEDLFTTISSIQDAASNHLTDQTPPDQPPTNTPTPHSPLVRAWFYFPSISTRAKRLDLITHAPSYSLTGFLFAGKPGLLCLEGTSPNIDSYMKFIKTESWGDIPSHHKKVSERLREEGPERKGVERAFSDMQEITDEVGERRGARANRGDMGAVEEWLGERGLGSVLAKVLM